MRKLGCTAGSSLFPCKENHEGGGDTRIGVAFRDAKEKGGEGQEVSLSVGDREDGLSWCRSCSVPWGDDFFSESVGRFRGSRKLDKIF